MVHVALFVVLAVVVKLMSAYIVAATSADFLLTKAALLWGFPWYSPHLFWVGVAFTKHAIFYNAMSIDIVLCMPHQ